MQYKYFKRTEKDLAQVTHGMMHLNPPSYLKYSACESLFHSGKCHVPSTILCNKYKLKNIYSSGLLDISVVNIILKP